jgi:hypothetical protein
LGTCHSKPTDFEQLRSILATSTALEISEVDADHQLTRRRLRGFSAASGKTQSGAMRLDVQTRPRNPGLNVAIRADSNRLLKAGVWRVEEGFGKPIYSRSTMTQSVRPWQAL